MYHPELSAEIIVAGLLNISQKEPVAILDSCGAGYLNSHLLIGGLNPLKTLSLNHADPAETLSELDKITEASETAAVFTISYDFGRKLLNIGTSCYSGEPDVFIHVFENLIVHDYSEGKTAIHGNAANSNRLARRILEAANGTVPPKPVTENISAKTGSNFTKQEYLERIEQIKTQIRLGNTYQTNLTQRFEVELPSSASPQLVYQRLRKSHPAAFSAFISREENDVVSISPERFIQIGAASIDQPRVISASPIKGTRKRGSDPDSDERLRKELLASKKDRAENTMIVDLIRNDLGRVCEYGSVEVEKLCALEEHATLFHLVSTIRGQLRKDIAFSDVLKAVFPCGSITGCPKISTMKIIDEFETVPRGLSMGAIGYAGFDGSVDLNVAIRTMVFRGNRAVFNVGGGIVIDSDPESEYLESLLKAKALFSALDVERRS